MLLLVLGASGSFAEEVSFNRDVRPILSDRCFACHGPDEHERKASLRLDVADGEDGAYRTKDGLTGIKPGSLEDSDVWYRITTTEEDEVMPPPKAHKPLLTTAEQDVIKRWILAGAPYEEFWAFVPPVQPSRPAVRTAGGGGGPIDPHVVAVLEAEDLAPSPEADRRTLIRRVTLDLTGLPPSLEAVHEFLADDGPEAYENLVDRLLAEPQYGEHMARYWLDLVRFADTNGMHKDFYRNNVAYRDWVIRSFNENLGYDDFVRYQLAGDLYPDPTDDQLAASGFHRLHLIIDKGTALPEESFFKNVSDRVTAVGTAFMGLTMQCASCHDHKYDPVTKKDYYSLFAFFNNIDAEPETRGREKDGLQAPIALLGPVEDKRALTEAQARLATLDPELKDARKQVGEEKDPARKKSLEEAADSLQKERDQLTRRIGELRRTVTTAMVMRERAEVRPTFIANRGNYDDPGEEVTRNTPEFLPPLKKEGQVASRRDLAEWLVARTNPLTARVAVNRFWQQFFGVGLVKTSEDLGAQGEIPSHPELLDELTVRFVESGWDVKALVKDIVMSKTYRQSSVAAAGRFAADPENRLLSRGARFRMDAEMIRDQILATSGLLSPTMYGPSVKPPQPDGLWKAVTMIGERYRPDTGESIYRRSLYTYWKRGMPPPQMTILNAPIRDSCIARRERTNTPAQALLLLNEAEYLKAARHLAHTLLKETDLGESERLGRAYETVTMQLPDASERAILNSLLGDLRTRYQQDEALAARLCEGVETADAASRAELAAWTVLLNTLYNLDITKTKQ